MTNGGPGIASEVPAKFVMDHLFERGNVGLATAAATSMLITVVAVIAPLALLADTGAGDEARGMSATAISAARPAARRADAGAHRALCLPGHLRRCSSWCRST